MKFTLRCLKYTYWCARYTHMYSMFYFSLLSTRIWQWIILNRRADLELDYGKKGANTRSEELIFMWMNGWKTTFISTLYPQQFVPPKWIEMWIYIHTALKRNHICQNIAVCIKRISYLHVEFYSLLIGVRLVSGRCLKIKKISVARYAFSAGWNDDI